ncbi:MAG: NifB/NifX family molybdenum-iron cluster-binding protein [Candidatus Methanomethylophilaceae archaeon]|nr:NifB/NifX family molybdenum-iron cluster-binding protein [Candidatus Methanomethylophilaceae archaeon]
MRLFVVSEGESLDSYVADDFGHAPFFLVVDSDTLDYHVVVNEHADAPEGAGMAVANAIVSLEVDAVITGGIGMHGYKILNDAGIQVSSDEEGTVEDCIRDFMRRVEHRRKFENQPGE